MLRLALWFGLFCCSCWCYRINGRNLPGRNMLRASTRLSLADGSAVPFLLESDAQLSMGSPSSKPLPRSGFYRSSGGVKIHFDVESIAQETAHVAVEDLVDKLDNNKGVLLRSSYDYPGRYSRWTVGFTAPAVQIDGNGFDFNITALNKRGEVLCRIIQRHLSVQSHVFTICTDTTADFTVIRGSVIRDDANAYFPEEERSKQASLFSLVRAVRYLFLGDDAGQLGLYGALGYDLTFQFEPVQPKKTRDSDQRDLVLFLPDEILVVDNQKNDAYFVRYDFTDETDDIEGISSEIRLAGHTESSSSRKEGTSHTTIGKPRTSTASEFKGYDGRAFEERDTAQGAYAERVMRAQQEFRVGNLFEVVLSQTFRRKMETTPSTIFRRLSKRNPSPYGFFMNLGNDEYLVGASPEMFVRVEKVPLTSSPLNVRNSGLLSESALRVETCPISGTIERGSDPLEDAQQIKKLLSSSKEESELTMCTDVDRNDKSRICIPGSVRVLGRRQIELYSRLIHTVDHVEGYLREQFDALDAFLCHTWAVTVTGAPKTWAIRFVEQMESSVRHWYGGAVGFIGFDGSMNTGLTLRTVRIKNGVAEVRAGATLLHDSDPAAEEAETELKASAMLDAIVRADIDPSPPRAAAASIRIGEATVVSNKKVLLIDHEDSFVHTLANYFRQSGAEVVTCRSGSSLQKFIAERVDTGDYRPDVVVLSPGPGNPADFGLLGTIRMMIERQIPMFGVCLGLQGLVEYFGGTLGVLDYPMHGKPSTIHRHFDDGTDVNNLSFDLLSGLPRDFQVARYHSLHGVPEGFPDELLVTASTDDGVVMAVQHRSMPLAAVQFHPESILTLPKHGLMIVNNALKGLHSDHYQR